MDKLINKIFIFIEIVLVVVAFLVLFGDTLKVTAGISKTFTASYYECVFGYKSNGYKYLEFSVGNFIVMALVYISIIFGLLRIVLKRINTNVILKYVSAGLFIVTGFLLFFTDKFVNYNDHFDFKTNMLGVPVTAGVFLVITGLLIIAGEVITIIYSNRLTRKAKVKKIKNRNIK